MKSPYAQFAKDNTITLSIHDGPQIVMDRQGFWYNGTLIEDAGEVYDKFKEWIILAHNLDLSQNDKKNE